jgi:hypothetical protein
MQKNKSKELNIANEVTPYKLRIDTRQIFTRHETEPSIDQQQTRKTAKNQRKSF